MPMTGSAPREAFMTKRSWPRSRLGQLNQPVKVVMTRQQIFHLVGLRPTSSQRVRLGAGPDGRLTAIAHEVNMYTSSGTEYVEQTATSTRSLYAAPNRL